MTDGYNRILIVDEHPASPAPPAVAAVLDDPSAMPPRLPVHGLRSL